MLELTKYYSEIKIQKKFQLINWNGDLYFVQVSVI